MLSLLWQFYYYTFIFVIIIITIMKFLENLSHWVLAARFKMVGAFTTERIDFEQQRL